MAGELWFTQNRANVIGRMSPDGDMLGEYDIPTQASGPRAMLALTEHRLFFGQHDVGAIGELSIAG